MHPDVRIGHVHLKVANLERAIGFYHGVLGFDITQRYGPSAAFLSAGGYHHHIGLNTWESFGGSAPAPGTTGLYHVAILYPTRADLAEALRRVLDAGIALDGAADHGVSEALYLRDPDDNGVELYWDRPEGNGRERLTEDLQCSLVALTSTAFSVPATRVTRCSVPVHVTSEDRDSGAEAGAAPGARKSGFVAFVGRPNAGKSTLLNRIVGHKLAIVSDKPQTTRTRIVGAKNYSNGQVVFVDTPGVHKPTHRMNVRMVDVALEAMRDVDLVTLIVDVSAKAGPGDRHLLELMKNVSTPVVLALNKVDLVAKPKLLPIIDRYSQAHPFVAIVPISAADGTNVNVLESLFLQHLPEGDPLYPDDFVTDQPDRFFVSEIVREQVLQLTHDELPFSTAVVVDRFEEPTAGQLSTIYCTILVERESQKPIVIGKGGAMIKEIGTAARRELERFFGSRIHLDLHVKVRSEWRDDERALDDIGLRRS